MFDAVEAPKCSARSGVRKIPASNPLTPFPLHENRQGMARPVLWQHFTVLIQKRRLSNAKVDLTKLKIVGDVPDVAKI